MLQSISLTGTIASCHSSTPLCVQYGVKPPITRITEVDSLPVVVVR